MLVLLRLFPYINLCKSHHFCRIKPTQKTQRSEFLKKKKKKAAMGMVYKRIPCPYTKSDLMAIFYSKDKNGDGKLSISELSEAFNYLGSRWSGLRAMAALIYADSNGDGVITPNEMEKLIDYAFDCKYPVA